MSRQAASPTTPARPSARATPAQQVVAVVGSDPDLVEPVRRALAASGATVLADVLPACWAEQGAVAVLVDPDAQTWHDAAVAGVPAVLVTVEEPSGDDLLVAVGRGAVGHVPTGASPESWRDAIHAVERGEACFDRREVRRLLDALRQRRTDRRLTTREREVLAAIDAGHSVKQTAAALGISPRTVENVQRFLFQKLEVTSRAEAAAVCRAQRMLDRAVAP